MKKLALTIAIVLGLGLTSFAEGNQGGGLFQRGTAKEMSNRDGDSPMLPSLPMHNQSTNQDAPIGSGSAMLIGLGAAYLIGKRRKQE